mmetsp:Transcript_112689/g.217060  ORF Transcript_112689/g.217060 Transcript_112689/m.217060 type:complete len:212 (+) Transcript_112689:2-637(+)
MCSDEETCDTSEGGSKTSSPPRATLWADITSEDEGDDFWLPATKDATEKLVEGKCDDEWEVVADKNKRKKKSRQQNKDVQHPPSYAAKVKEPPRAEMPGSRQASLASSQKIGKGQEKVREDKKLASSCRQQKHLSQPSDKQAVSGRAADQGGVHRAKSEFARTGGNAKDEGKHGTLQKTRGPQSTHERHRQQRRSGKSSAEDWMAKRMAAV